MKFRLNTFVALTVSICMLSGCGTVMNATGKGYGGSYAGIDPPKQAPKIIYGQKAYVAIYGGSAPADIDIKNELEAWRKTGLFSSVESTMSRTPLMDARTPPINGVLIVRACRNIHYNSYRHSGVARLLWALSLGLLPSIGKVDNYCDLEFYQNGRLIAKSEFTYEESQIQGLAELSAKPDEVWKKETQMMVNNLLSNIK